MRVREVHQLNRSAHIIQKCKISFGLSVDILRDTRRVRMHQVKGRERGLIFDTLARHHPKIRLFSSLARKGGPEGWLLN